MAMDSTFRVYGDSKEYQPGVRVILRYDPTLTMAHHGNTADAVICYFDGHRFHETITCTVTYRGNGEGQINFRPAEDPYDHPYPSFTQGIIKTGIHLLKLDACSYFHEILK